MAKPVALANFGVYVEIYNRETQFMEGNNFRFEDEQTRDDFVDWMVRTREVEVQRIRKFVETVHPDLKSAQTAALYARNRKING